MAGADISEFQALRAEPGAMDRHSQAARAVFDAWQALPQPVIAAVQASAVGGGLEIALLCDLIVADPAARFGLPEVKLGLIPGGGGTPAAAIAYRHRDGEGTAVPRLAHRCDRGRRPWAWSTR